MIFCLLGSWSFSTEGKGIQKIMKSVARLMADEKYHMDSVSRQNPAVLGTMNEMGKQETPRSVACTHAQITTYTIAQRQTRCTAFETKMRRYWRRNETLAMFIPML